MATERHTTILEVDASQALAAESRLERATEARVEAVRELARLQSQQERDRIAALRESENAAKRLAAVERQQRLEARELVRSVRDEEVRARRAAVDAARAAQAEAKAAAADDRAWVSAIKAVETAQREAEIELSKTTKTIERMDKAWRKMPGPGLLEQFSFKAKELSDRFEAWGKKFKGALDVGSKIGGVVTGLQSLIGMVQQAAAVIDDMAQQSVQAKTVGANLAISIDGARAAFKGYVDDVELARIANQAYELGVVTTGDELAALAAGVQAKAEKLGVSSTELFENAVTAIGRGSALILDNLGIILDQAKAEEIYAEALGVTTDQLSAVQKEQAFAKAAMIEISKASKTAAKENDGLAESWRRLTTDVANAKNEMLGFDASMASTKEAIRALSEDQLERLRFGEVADDASTAGKELNGMLEGWGVSLADVRRLADETGVSYQELIKQAQQDIGTREAERARKEMEATHRELAGMLEARADEVDQAAKLTGILDTQGKQEIDILRMQEEALELRLEAAEAIKDQNAALELTRALEENRARQEVAGQRKRGGRGGDPNAALKRQLELTLATLDAQRQILEANAELQRDEQDRLAIQTELVNLARRELDARQAAAEAMKVRGAQERLEQEIELMEIATERRLLGIAVELDARERERVAVEQRITQIEREIEVQERLGAGTQLLERQLLQAQITLAEQYGTAEDQAAQVHALALERADEIAAARVADEQAALDAYQRDIERKQAAGWQEQDLFARRIELEIELAQAAGDTDRVRQLYHEQEIHRIKREVDVRQRALSATNQALTAGMQLFSLVAEQSIKDERKREKAMMRARGIEALARGAIETVESVAAFASFNYVQGALHAAAAGVAYATGASLLAGKPPSRGGEGATSAAGGGAEHQTALPDSGNGGRGRDAAAVPPSAEELLRLRQQQMGTTETTASKGGGTVINIGTIVAGDAGSLIHDTANGEMRKWGTG